MLELGNSTRYLMRAFLLPEPVLAFWILGDLLELSKDPRRKRDEICLL